MEDNSPYQASKLTPSQPSAAAPDVRSDSWVIEIPPGMTSPIKHLWILLATLAALALVAAMVLPFTGRSSGTFLGVVFGFTGVMYAFLAVGVYQRSQVVAAGVAAISVIGLLGAFVRAAQGDVSLVSIGVSLVTTIAAVRGTIAINAFNRFVADARRRPPGPRLSDDPAFAQQQDV